MFSTEVLHIEMQNIDGVTYLAEALRHWYVEKDIKCNVERISVECYSLRAAASFIKARAG